MRSHMNLFVVAFLVLFGAMTCSAAEGPELSVATGTVAKADKDLISIATSDKRKLDLKVTGTSNLRILTPQKRADRTVITQRNTDAADLMPGQMIAVIYTISDKEKVLLSAVVKPAEK